jgi:hypothetical protein
MTPLINEASPKAKSVLTNIHLVVSISLLSWLIGFVLAGSSHDSNFFNLAKGFSVMFSIGLASVILFIFLVSISDTVKRLTRDNK